MTERTNIYIDQGVDFSTTLSLFDEDIPIDVTGFEFFSQIRKIYSTAIIANFTISEVDPESGILNLILPASVTSELPPGKYVFDILLRYENGEITKILEGLVFIIQTVTRIES
jgi:hypothetical protein